MNKTSSIAANIAWCLLVSAIGSLFSWKWIEIKPDLLKELLQAFVTFGVTMGGFVLTALSILAGFSGTSFMVRVFKASDLSRNLIEVFLLTIVTNLLLAVGSVIGIALWSSPTQNQLTLDWIQQISIFFFVASMYFTVFCLAILRSIIRGIIRLSNQSEKETNGNH